MAHLFFLLSGEHDTLPEAELKAILEAEGYAFRTVEKLDQVLRLEADLNCTEVVRQRAAFTRLCGLELFSCEAKMNTIVRALKSTDLNETLRNGESFAVRVRRVKESALRINTMVLERKLGELILSQTAGTTVNLRKPRKTFIGVLTGKKFVFGVKLVEVPAKPFAVERRPKKRPFFHPSAMTAKLARGMVNLAQPKRGDLLLDPFCGTGSTLIEAALIGCRVMGLDIRRRMVRGSLRNSAFFNVEPLGVVVADARNPPVAAIDCVVTDPPYGRSTTTLKRTTEQVIREVLTAVHDMLGKGHRVCIAAPKALNVKKISTKLGYRHLESHFVYVHRSLTREIAVLEKV